jgi:RNA polymerase sigma-70 factor (ECF subfamily)
MEYHEKYSNDIFRFCMVKTKNRDQALDMTQEAFMKFWEYLARSTEIDNPRALLYRIANNLIIDSYRKKKDVLVEDYSAQPLQQELVNDPRSRMENKIDGEFAIELLHELPELTREIITLKFLDNLSVSEIATIVDRDSKTVSVYLHRGLKKLNEILESYE